MKTPSPNKPWVLLLLGLSVTGLLAWAGLSLLGREGSGITVLGHLPQVERSGEQAEQGDPVESPQGKGVGGLELDREHAKDLEIEVSVLALLSRDVESEDGEGLASLLLQSSRAGKPMPFRWRFDAGPEAGRQAECQGEQALRGLRPGWYVLSLLGPGGAIAPRILQLHPEKKGIVRVDWTHTGRTRGRVFGPQGEPIQGAHVQVGVQVGKVEAKTDADGRFELTGLWPGSGLPLLIEARGMASRVEPIGVVASSEPPRELRFVLEEGAEVEGLVEMPREEWKHARIFLLPGSSSARNRSGRGYAHLPLYWKGRFSDLRLDERGRFRIQGLSRSLPLALGLVHPRYRLALPISLPVLERVGKAQAQVLLQPDEMRVISGKITAKDGKPVQARLEMRGKGRWGEAYFRGGVRPPLQSSVAGMGNTVAASDKDGRYSMGVPDRGSELRVQAPGFSPLHEPAPRGGSTNFQMERITSGSSAQPLVLRLRFTSEVTKEGKVRALRVHLTKKGESSPKPILIDPREPYEIRFVQPGRVRVSIRTKGDVKPLFLQEFDLRSDRSLSVQ